MEKSDKEFADKIFEHTNKKLVERLRVLRPISQTEFIKAEVNRRLIDSIHKFNKNSSKYSKWIIGLTIVLGVLAIVQIVILLRPLFTQA